MVPYKALQAWAGVVKSRSRTKGNDFHNERPSKCGGRCARDAKEGAQSSFRSWRGSFTSQQVRQTFRLILLLHVYRIIADTLKESILIIADTVLCIPCSIVAKDPPTCSKWLAEQLIPHRRRKDILQVCKSTKTQN